MVPRRLSDCPFKKVDGLENLDQIEVIAGLAHFTDDEARSDAKAISPKPVIGGEPIWGLKNQETAVAWYRADAMRYVASLKGNNQSSVNKRSEQLIKRQQRGVQNFKAITREFFDYLGLVLDFAWRTAVPTFEVD